MLIGEHVSVVSFPVSLFSGFRCFRMYFESVNSYEHKLRKSDQSVIVEKHDLVGLNYLWQIVLETPYPDIAEDASHYLIQLSYAFLSPKLKKVTDISHSVSSFSI